MEVIPRLIPSPICLLNLCDDLLVVVFSYLPMVQRMTQTISVRINKIMCRATASKVITFEDINFIFSTSVIVRIPRQIDKISYTSMRKDELFVCHHKLGYKLGWYAKNGIGLYWHYITCTHVDYYEIHIDTNITEQLFLLQNIVSDIKIKNITNLECNEASKTSLIMLRFWDTLSHVISADCKHTRTDVYVNGIKINIVNHKCFVHLNTNDEMRWWFNMLVSLKNPVCGIIT